MRLVALVIISLCLLTACSHVQKAWMASWGDPYEEEDLFDEGEKVYAIHCVDCHGETGVGDGPKSSEIFTTMPNFADGSYRKPLGLVAANINYGKRLEMPPFRKEISDREIWAVARYVRSLSGTE